MSEQETEELIRLLKRGLPRAGEVELGHDLWPSMLRRLQETPIRAPWWDWALLAAASALILFFPGMIPALLYHF
jgi:hypothetical protein